MGTTPNETGKATGSDEQPDDQVAPVPNERGPHDVPDDKVIEKTLPTKPMSEPGGRGAP